LKRLKKRHSEIQHLGCTDKDIDQITGDLREEGKRVLNLKEEEERRRKLNEKERKTC